MLTSEWVIKELLMKIFWFSLVRLKLYDFKILVIIYFIIIPLCNKASSYLHFFAWSIKIGIIFLFASSAYTQ